MLLSVYREWPFRFESHMLVEFLARTILQQQALNHRSPGVRGSARRLGKIAGP